MFLRGIIICFAAIFICASITQAADSRLEKLASKGTAAQMKEYLMKSRRFTQTELDDALMASIDNADTAVMQMLLAAGADPDTKNKSLPEEEGEYDYSILWGPLELVVSGKNWIKANILLQAGAIPSWNSLEENSFESPGMMEIAEFAPEYIVRLAIKNSKMTRKNKQIKDYNGLTAYDHAKKNKNLSREVREMFR